jgi:hypothetical protein
MTPSEFHSNYYGWGIDVDGVAGIQCVDFFKEFLRIIGCPTYKAPIGGDGYADNIWYNRSRWNQWFTFIPAGQFQDGDIVLFPHRKRGGKTHPLSHICFYYGGKQFGTNQHDTKLGRRACDKPCNWSDALGALRYKFWETTVMTIPKGYSKQTINGHAYMIYRQKDDQKIGVLSAGGKNLRSIGAHDAAGVYVYAKLGGANFFQMQPGDDYGTHYGDEVSPLNGVYQIVPTQDSTLYYNLETGKYANATGYYPDKAENVFSPAVVYHDGTYEYAKMVGVNHVNVASIYTALIRLKDGTYIMALSASNTTPKTMYNDFRSIDSFESMAVLDGGGSAQMQAWHDGKMYTVRGTTRLLPSVVAFYTQKSNGKPADDKTSTEDYKALYEAENAKYEVLQTSYTALEKTADDLRSTITKITEEKQTLLGKIKQAADILKADGE